MPAVLALALLSALYPLWQIWRIHPAEVLLQAPLFLPSLLKHLAPQPLERHLLAMFTHCQWHGSVQSDPFAPASVIAISSLFLSVILLTIMVDELLAFRQTLQGTLLGDYVLLQTAVPQIAGATFAVLLTFLSVADLLLLQVRERQKEIEVLQAVGCRPRIVQGLFVQEGLTLPALRAISRLPMMGILRAE